MKAMIGLSAMCWLMATGFVATSANAHDVATRCGAYSCSTIVCDRTGDRCRRYDEDRGNWSDRRRDGYEDAGYGRQDGYQDSGYWRYRDGRWRSNCDPDNPTCVVRAERFDHDYVE